MLTQCRASLIHYQVICVLERRQRFIETEYASGMIVFQEVLVDILDCCERGLNVGTDSTHRISRAGPDNVTEQREVIRAAMRSPEEQYRMESSAHLLVSGILLRMVECLGHVREVSS